MTRPTPPAGLAGPGLRRWLDGWADGARAVAEGRITDQQRALVLARKRQKRRHPR